MTNAQHEQRRTGSFAHGARYGAMVGGAALLLLWIETRGADLVATRTAHAPAAAAAAGDGVDVLAHVLFALALITLLARATGVLLHRWFGQPLVMGEILAGLLLGPSVLGAFWPEAQAFVLPASCAPHLGLVAQLGVVLFLFLVGLELDLARLRESTRAFVFISHASIVAPLLLGTGLALWLYPRHASADVPFLAFSLFMGIALSVTAFPVLARILVDRGIQATPLGTTALACAAVDDATAWTLLALLTALVDAELARVGRTLAMLLVYLVLMASVVRPLLARLAAREERREGPLSHTVLAAVFAGLLLSAVATEALGIHALFGAFLFGALVPAHGRLAVGLRERMESVVLVLLLPAFFALTGMRTRIGLLASGADWLACAAIVAVATVGKLGGTALAARVSGMEWRRATALGILMNTRGLMELIVLNLGLDLGVITPEVFAMMVVMALVTTFTAPLALDMLERRAPVA